MSNIFYLQSAVLSNRLWSRQSHLWQHVGLVILGVCLLALSAQVSIPLHPVPLTFQSATVLLIGMTLGSRLGASVILTYWLAGILGAPVFANLHSGFSVFLESDSGYLLGFLPAAVIAGWFVEHGWGKSIISTFAAALMGALCLFILGAFWLRFFMDWHTVWLVGVKPFMLTECVKLILMAWVAKRCWQVGD